MKDVAALNQCYKGLLSDLAKRVQDEEKEARENLATYFEKSNLQQVPVQCQDVKYRALRTFTEQMQIKGEQTLVPGETETGNRASKRGQCNEKSRENSTYIAWQQNY